MSLLGSIDAGPAILLAERAAFATDIKHLSAFTQSLHHIQNLGANDIYSWFLASGSFASIPSEAEASLPQTQAHTQPPDLKLNLIYPCTAQHVAKYSAQGVRVVTETPAIYRDHVSPYMKKKRDSGSLAWVYNIIDGRTEQEDVIFRQHSSSSSATITSNTPATASSPPQDEGFLLLPDLNWDRKTLTSMHLLAVVERRDIWSVRDLTRDHIPWLKHMREKVLAATTELYPEVERDQVKLYVHYQPTYYHFHVHVVHVMAEASATMAVGKALGLEGVVELLEKMDGAGSMGEVNLTYTIGEASELWLEVFEPLKRAALGKQSV